MLPSRSPSKFPPSKSKYKSSIQALLRAEMKNLGETIDADFDVFKVASTQKTATTELTMMIKGYLAQDVSHWQMQAQITQCIIMSGKLEKLQRKSPESVECSTKHCWKQVNRKQHRMTKSNVEETCSLEPTTWTTSPATGVPTSHWSKPGPAPHCLAQTAAEIADNDCDLLSGASEVREAAVEHNKLSCAQPTQRQLHGNLSPCRHSETVWMMLSSCATDRCRWILSLL